MRHCELPWQANHTCMNPEEFWALGALVCTSLNIGWALMVSMAVCTSQRNPAFKPLTSSTVGAWFCTVFFLGAMPKTWQVQKKAWAQTTAREIDATIWHWTGAPTHGNMIPLVKALCQWFHTNMHVNTWTHVGIVHKDKHGLMRTSTAMEQTHWTTDWKLKGPAQAVRKAPNTVTTNPTDRNFTTDSLPIHHTTTTHVPQIHHTSITHRTPTNPSPNHITHPPYLKTAKQAMQHSYHRGQQHETIT